MTHAREQINDVHQPLSQHCETSPLPSPLSLLIRLVFVQVLLQLLSHQLHLWVRFHPRVHCLFYLVTTSGVCLILRTCTLKLCFFNSIFKRSNWQFFTTREHNWAPSTSQRKCQMFSVEWTSWTYQFSISLNYAGYNNTSGSRLLFLEFCYSVMFPRGPLSVTARPPQHRILLKC